MRRGIGARMLSLKSIGGPGFASRSALTALKGEDLMEERHRAGTKRSGCAPD